jgi:spore germination cell wall hydrolase CwlJ-like protein
MDSPFSPDTLLRSAEAADRADAAFLKRTEPNGPSNVVGKKTNAVVALPPRRSDGRRIAILLCSAGFGLLLAGSVAHFQLSADTPKGAIPTPAQTAAAAAPVVNLLPPDLLRPLSPEEAAKENADRPFVARSDTPASGFVLRVGAEDRDRALTCLTQAIYYEAASEGADGGRAVAQVVLNRMHHPGYPASVCGVVYEGSDRATGCQFTFTCDGSLLRTPVEALWTRSRKIAAEALAGRVFAPIGHATSYHADYVLPYWADALDKTVQIGRHIFYRLRGTYGDGRSFFQRYAGVEPQLPDPRPSMQVPPSADATQLANALMGDDLKGATPAVEKAAAPASTPLADADRPTLVADAQAPVANSRRAKPASQCAEDGASKQLNPLSANDMRSGVAAPGC